MKFSGIDAFKQTDTSSGAARVYFEALRLASPSRRLKRALELSARARALSLAGLGRLHPELSHTDLRLLLVEQVHGEAVAARCRKHLARSSR